MIGTVQYDHSTRPCFIHFFYFMLLAAADFFSLISAPTSLVLLYPDKSAALCVAYLYLRIFLSNIDTASRRGSISHIGAVYVPYYCIL